MLTQCSFSIERTSGQDASVCWAATLSSGQCQRRWANIETTLCEYPVWTCISSQLAYNTIPSKHYTQLNAGLTLIHSRQLWRSVIGGGVSTEYKLTPI